MGFRNARWLVCVIGAFVGGCALPNEAEILQPPDMIGELANANLSAPPVSHSRAPQLEYASARTETGSLAKVYPGADAAVRERVQATENVRGVEKKQDGYQLNFSDAQLPDLVKVILKDTLDIAYVYDPRVKGRVTISTGGPVSRKELLSILESVLGMFNGALLVDNNLYRIVPAAEAGRQAISTIDYAKEAQEVGPGYGVSIVPLKYVSSETMTQLLDSLSPNPNKPQTAVQDNLLIIRGNGREREALLEIVYSFDVDWMKGQSAGIFTLENAAPDEIIPQLQQVFQTDGRGKGSITFQPLTRLNGVLVLTQKARLLHQAGDWIKRLDSGGPEAENYYVYRVENGRAADLAQLLMATFTGKGLGTRNAEESEVSPGQAADRTQSSNGSGLNGSSGSGTLGNSSSGSSGLGLGSSLGASSNGSAGSVSAGASGSSYRTGQAQAAGALVSDSNDASPEQQQTSGPIQITPDERSNKLLIKASGRDLRKILSILRRIDKTPMQVLINATLAEVTLNDNLEYGVQFYLQKHAGSLGFTSGQSIDIAPAVPGMNFIVGALAPSPKVVLDALASVTTVRVVSSPSVVVVHNQPATLLVGDEIPYTSRSAVGVVDPEAPVVNEIEYKNTGVILKVTPKINSNGLVTMTIDQEVSTVADNGSADTLTPTISQRSITSTIAVQSGQMVVLGGLISENTTRKKNNIPVLNKIPYLGDVLGAANNTQKARTELVVFLQPRVIRNPQEASEVAEEMRARMQSLAPRPAAWDAHVESPGAEADWRHSASIK